MTLIRPLVVLSALTVFGCRDSTGLERDMDARDAASVLIASSEAIAAIGVTLDDATGRVLASFDDAVVVEQLRGHLRELSAALDARNETRARRELTLARTLIAHATSEAPDTAADLGAVELALDRAQALLDGTAEDTDATDDDR